MRRCSHIPEPLQGIHHERTEPALTHFGHFGVLFTRLQLQDRLRLYWHVEVGTDDTTGLAKPNEFVGWSKKGAWLLAMPNGPWAAMFRTDCAQLLIGPRVGIEPPPWLAWLAWLLVMPKGVASVF